MDYFILKSDGEQTGTYSLDQIRAMLKTGFVGPDTCYWHEGIVDWQPIERIEESLGFTGAASESGQKVLPPPHRLKGSLARAIPSPQQQKRPLPGEPSPGPAPEIAASAETVFGPAEAPAIPTATTLPYLNGKTVHHAEPAAPALAPIASPVGEMPFAPASVRKKTRWQFPVSTTYLLYAGPALLIALAIIAAIIASRHPARSPLSKVTLTDRNVYVLLEQSKIGDFATAMRTSPVAAALVRQMAQSNDPVFIQRMSVGLQKETVQHRVEVTQHFLESGAARIIEPGDYTALSYFDDKGAIVVPRAGEPWVAVLYRGNIVFAYVGTEFVLKPQ